MQAIWIYIVTEIVFHVPRVLVCCKTVFCITFDPLLFNISETTVVQLLFVKLYSSVTWAEALALYLPLSGLTEDELNFSSNAFAIALSSTSVITYNFCVNDLPFVLSNDELWG